MSLGLIQRSRVHPWAVLREAERTLGQLQPRTVRPAGAQRPFAPRIEAHETESGWEVSAELPGVAREDLDVFVQDGVLTIRGARRFGRRETQAIDTTTAGAEPAEADAEAADASAAETEDASALRFERRIRFNGDVDEDAVSARYADGLLEVVVPRVVPPEPEVRTIPIQVA